MKIRHILVAQKYQAEDIEKKIKSEVDFQAMAVKHSTCSSAKSGGDLGDLSKKMEKLDESFREACESLQVGGISKPIRTRFGYHLIQRYG